jgi:hypothetical protein
VGCSCSGTGGSVVKPLQHLARQEGGFGVFREAMLLLLYVVIPTRTGWHSHRRVRSPAVAQPRRNKQALPVERLCKFYLSDDMSKSVHVYIAQGFYTVNGHASHVLWLA